VPSVDVAEIPNIVRFALVLAFLGAIDSLLTSLVADSMTRSSHDSNRELVGQGLGNIAAGLFGGIPSAGATMRTLVNLRAGGRTRLSGVIHSIILAAILLGFGGMVSLIPIPVLAAILVKVGIDIVDWQYLGRIRIMPRSEIAVMLATLLLTVLVDLITAVAVGFVMASVLFVARVAESQVRGARFVFGADDIEDLSTEESELLNASQGRLVLFHVEGPLSFGSARDLAKLLQSNLEKDVLAIDMRDVPFIDGSACTAIVEVIDRLHDDGDWVLLFGLRGPVRDMLYKSGALESLPEERMVSSRIEAIKLGLSIIEDNDRREEK
jgi:SulP family sulfate permease